MRPTRLTWFVLLALTGLFFWAMLDVAAAQSTDDYVEHYLSERHSPLPAYTIVAYWRTHPDFDIAGYLTVMSCESSLGTTGGSHTYNNPGNLKPSKASNPWQQLANGTWYCRGQGTYNTYSDMYTGQRAAILLIAARYPELAADDWWGFANRYYGRNVPGIGQYVRNLQAVHARVVADAKAHGFTW